MYIIITKIPINQPIIQIKILLIINLNIKFNILNILFLIKKEILDIIFQKTTKKTLNIKFQIKKEIISFQIKKKVIKFQLPKRALDILPQITKENMKL